MSGPQAALLADGRRLHLHHGPIDLIIEAFGDDGERRSAYRQAFARFETVLAELVTELPALRRPIDPVARLNGPVARRMARAVRAHRPVFVTPMAAVAGAVADEIRDALCQGRSLARAYVNNGGDVAVHLGPGTELTVAVASDPTLAERVGLRFDEPARGLATSGWRGRSWSLGIADTVTVKAADAAAADAAATLIANAIDLPDHPAIRRTPASQLDPDSDLGDRPVTVAVGPLAPREIQAALEAGADVAAAMLTRGLIDHARLALAGETITVEPSLTRPPVAAHH